MADNNGRREWREKHRTRNTSSFSEAFSPIQLTSRRSRLVALASIAIVSGSVGATITSQVFAYKTGNIVQAAIVPPAPAAPQIETTTVLVAARKLRFGDKIDSESVKATKWISGTEPKGSFKTLKDVMAGVDRRAALGPIEEDEPILSGKITGPGERATLSALVEDGKRAVTVPVDEIFGVAGFVLPGDRVDVVLTRSVKPGDLSTSQADVILQNVKVLAIDQQTNQREEVANVARAVTLEVDTLMAQKLALGNSIGRLSLILQAAGSGHSQDVGPVSLADLSGETVKSRAINIIRGAGSNAAPALRAPANTGQTAPVQVPVQGMPQE